MLEVFANFSVGLQRCGHDGDVKIEVPLNTYKRLWSELNTKNRIKDFVGPSESIKLFFGRGDVEVSARGFEVAVEGKNQDGK